ncbi:hypothetical protein SEA_FINKLE_40 [Gordonia phage Finkle]|uniref:Uncharacterized protein n=1 Tax=Gordonia phage Finkle TaxID=2926099 RepID=A0A9E7NK98_9CAUD|nr:hypothetical protein QEH33_gp40 [Gordonia phage Finkle]UTN93000.1 hypothetical protein SEA_FINKLE_40 [Gordonia phage Finkle]
MIRSAIEHRRMESNEVERLCQVKRGI